jgi:hypothetical protein
VSQGIHRSRRKYGVPCILVAKDEDTGEDWAVYSSDQGLNNLVASFRDWARDCYCRSGKENTCGL